MTNVVNPCFIIGGEKNGKTTLLNHLIDDIMYSNPYTKQSPNPNIDLYEINKGKLFQSSNHQTKKDYVAVLKRKGRNTVVINTESDLPHSWVNLSSILKQQNGDVQIITALNYNIAPLEYFNQKRLSLGFSFSVLTQADLKSHTKVKFGSTSDYDYIRLKRYKHNYPSSIPFINVLRKKYSI